MGVRVPVYLSKPARVLFFDSDDVCMFVLFLCVGLTLGGWLNIVTIAGPVAYYKIKKRYPAGFLSHMIYFAGLKDFAHYPGFFHKHFYE